MGFDHFKRLVRYLSLLHARVLQAGGVPIPAPVTAGRVLCAHGLAELSGPLSDPPKFKNT